MEKCFNDAHFWFSDDTGNEAENAISKGMSNEQFNCLEHIPVSFDDERDLLLAA